MALKRANKRKRGDGDDDDDGNDLDEAEAMPVERIPDMDNLDVSGLAEADEVEWENEGDDAESRISSAPTTPVVDSPAFDLATNHSASSSSSSITPPSITEQPERPANPPADPVGERSAKTATHPSSESTRKPPPAQLHQR